MKFGRHAHVVIIAGSLIASPAAAADPRNISHIMSDHRSGIGPYVGLSITIRSDEGENATPRLGLAAGLGYDLLKGQATAGGGHAPLIELQPQAGSAEIFLRGRPLHAAEKGGGIGAGKILLAIAVAAGAALLVSQAIDSDEDEDDERCLIEPALCN